MTDTPADRLAEANARPCKSPDDAYSELSPKIQVGTMVTWINRGDAPGSTTVDAGSFGTGVYGTGEQASIAGDPPGTFSYYCTLHGAPGGLGMAATVIVEP